MTTYICNCGNENGHVSGQKDGFDKFDEAERSGIDAFEVKVFLLEGGTVMWNANTYISSFGPEEKVGQELHSVDLEKISFMEVDSINRGTNHQLTMAKM
jgi:hypothetical protein